MRIKIFSTIILSSFLIGCIENKPNTSSAWPTSLEMDHLNGNISEIRQYHILSFLDTLSSIFYYSENGMLIKSISEEGNRINEVKYDSENHPISEEIHDSLNKNTRRIIHTYQNNFAEEKMEVYEQNSLLTTYHFRRDSVGNILLQYGYSSRGSLIDSTKNEYNEKRLRTKQILYTEDIVYEFEYFENQLLKSKKQFVPERNEPYIVEFQYSFDRFGNWTSLSMVSEDHIISRVIREITYRKWFYHF